MVPRIGITTHFDERERSVYEAVNERYPWSVRAAGGLPHLLPVSAPREDANAYLEGMDGLLLSGGGDVASHLFGRDPVKAVTKSCLARDEFEIDLFRAARGRGIPIMGICRGLQVANVAMGGDLIQDIPSEMPDAIGHMQGLARMDELHHWVEAEGGPSELLAAFGERRFLVNSYHHQAAGRLAPGLRVTARSSDGIVEAFEAEEGYLLCVQFHPEGLTGRYPAFLRLFARFVEAAAAFRGASA
jgi:putative glutamine amidotransferase